MRFVWVLILLIVLPAQGIAGSVDDFARLSNQRDGLKAGDCKRYGGEFFPLSEKNLDALLQGQKVGGYNNVRQIENHIYIVYSYAEPGSILNSLIGNVSRVMSMCRF